MKRVILVLVLLISFLFSFDTLKHCKERRGMFGLAYGRKKGLVLKFPLSTPFVVLKIVHRINPLSTRNDGLMEIIFWNNRNGRPGDIIKSYPDLVIPRPNADTFLTTYLPSPCTLNLDTFYIGFINSDTVRLIYELDSIFNNPGTHFFYDSGRIDTITPRGDLIAMLIGFRIQVGLEERGKKFFNEGIYSCLGQRVMNFSKRGIYFRRTKMGWRKVVKIK